MNSWSIDKYRIIDELGEHTIGKLHKHKITIIDEEKQNQLIFEIEASGLGKNGLFVEILQNINYLYTFIEKHSHFNYFIENKMCEEKNYKNTVELSKKLKSFLQKDWLDSIQIYLKLV